MLFNSLEVIYMNKMDDIKYAAIHLFATKGYAATSMQEIADLVNLNKASLYFYIKSKRELFLMVIKEQFDQYMTAVQNRFKGSNDESIETLLYQIVKEILKHTSYEGLLFWKRTMIMAVSEVDDDIAKPLRNIVGSFEQHIHNILNQFMSSKNLHIEVEKASQFVTAYYFFMQSALDWRLLNLDADIEKYVPILWSAFWNGSRLTES